MEDKKEKPNGNIGLAIAAFICGVIGLVIYFKQVSGEGDTELTIDCFIGIAIVCALTYGAYKA